jgi:hypothetical protein
MEKIGISKIDIAGFLGFLIVMFTIGIQLLHHGNYSTALIVLIGIGVTVALYLMVLMNRMINVLEAMDTRQRRWEQDRQKDVINAETEVSEQIKERERVQARDKKQNK